MTHPLRSTRPEMLSVQRPFDITVNAMNRNIFNLLSASVQQVVEKEGTLYYTERSNWYDASWKPVLTTEARNLEVLATITTLHAYPAEWDDTPSIHEVFPQIPVGYIGRVTAFSAVFHRNLTPASWTEVDDEAEAHGFSLATATLYTHS